MLRKIASSEEEIEVLKEDSEKNGKTSRRKQNKNTQIKMRLHFNKLCGCSSNFKRAAPHAWLDIEIDDISDRQMESLVNRDKNFDAEKARRFCRLLVAEDEEMKKGG